MNTITVLLTEDHKIVREGLRAYLKQEPDIEIVGEAENGRQAVALASKLCPNVVVMDISMPLLNGMEATRQMLQTTPDTKVLILSAHCNEAYAALVKAIGASGYLNKQTNIHELVTAIREIHQGRSFFSPIVSKRLSDHEKSRARGGLPGEGASLLNSREVEVLQLVAEGRSNKQTAAELHVCTKTVEKHRQSLMDKLNIHNTAGLTRYAVATGVIECSVQVTVV